MPKSHLIDVLQRRAARRNRLRVWSVTYYETDGLNRVSEDKTIQVVGGLLAWLDSVGSKKVHISKVPVCIQRGNSTNGR